MGLLIKGLELDLPSRRLKIWLDRGPFHPQGLSFPGEGAIVAGNESLAQSPDVLISPENRQPLRISGARSLR